MDRAGLPGLRPRRQRRPHTIEASRAKAFTAVSAKAPTLTMMENAQKNSRRGQPDRYPRFLLLGGGVPIKAGSNVIGAIGVAGAPGGNLDAQCADAKLEENAALFK